MKVTVVRDYKELSVTAAGVVAGHIRSKPDAVVTLPSGGTPIGMYDELVRAYSRGEVDFSKVRLFDLDTYAGIPLSNPHSHHSYITEHLVSKTNFDKRNWFYLDSQPEDYAEFSKSYEEAVRKVGGIDLVMDGLGHNGHLGYNEPGASFGSRTGVVKIAQLTREANIRWFKSIDEVPTLGLTMGIATVLEAREIVILVSGRDKAPIVRRVVEGPVTEEAPMTAIRRHSNSRAIIDRDAAQLLTPDTWRGIEEGRQF